MRTTIDTQALSQLLYRSLDDPDILSTDGWDRIVAPVTQPFLKRVREEYARRRPAHPQFRTSPRSDVKHARQTFDSIFLPIQVQGLRLTVCVGLDNDTGERSNQLFAGLSFWGSQSEVEDERRRLEQRDVIGPDDETHVLSGKAFTGWALYSGLFLTPEEVAGYAPDELADLIVDTLVKWGDRVMTAQNELIAQYRNSKEDEQFWEDWCNRCQKREERRPAISQLVEELRTGERTLSAFAQAMHEESIQHPYWGFKGISGGMFLNLLAAAQERVGDELDVVDEIDPLLTAPSSQEEATNKINALVDLIERIKKRFSKRGLSPGYVPYFLTYFWQIQNPTEWLVYWPQTTRSYLEHNDLFQRTGNPAEDYFRYVEAAQLLHNEFESSIYWDVWAEEHPWWEVEGFTVWWRDHRDEPEPGPEDEETELGDDQPTVPIIDRVHRYMLARGYQFPRELLASYYIALQSKPFVILSGISGTGKTKLAQLFAEFMSPDASLRAFVPVRPDWTDSGGLIGFHHLLTGAYHSTDFLRLLLHAHCDSEQRPHFVLLDEMNLARVEHYFSDFLSAMESRQYTSARVSAETITQWQGKKVPSITIAKSVRDEWELQDGDTVELRIRADNGALLQDEFRLTSGGEVWLGEKGDRFNGAAELRTVVIDQNARSVTQDPFPLHDQPRCLAAAGNETNAEGFYDGGSDQKTCTVSCQGCPFSEFVDKQRWQDGTLDYSSAVKKGFDPRAFVPPRVTVPLNVFFTGTVNVDETTYSFSPKVLDRASVLEFNQVNLTRYFEIESSQKATKYATQEDIARWTANYGYPFVATGRSAVARKSEELALYRTQLAGLVEILAPYYMHFGYRVADEILAFLTNTQWLNDSDFTLSRAFDRALMQKVLPKFHGSRARLREPLVKLLAFCTEAGEPIEDDTVPSLAERVQEQAKTLSEETVDTLRSSTELGWRLPYTAKKILRLLRDLDLDGFAGSLR